MSESAPVAGRRPPALSVVVLTLGGFDLIRPTVETLRVQSVRDDIELIIVTPTAAGLGMNPAAAQEFGAVRVLEGNPARADGEARVLAVRQAQAPVVAFTEEHAFPEPGWAQALIKAHQGPWAAVGPSIVNANPASPISWASLFLDFGHSVAPAQAREAEHLASHNTSYKRAVLLDYGSRLADMLSSEENLFRDLRARGYRLYLEPAARVRHLNISTPAALLQAQFLGGRVFGGGRARREQLSWARRLIHILGGPWIGLARLRHVRRETVHTDLPGAILPWMLPALIVGLLAHGLGESVGWACGQGDASQRRNTYEHRRRLYVQERDLNGEAAE